MILPEINKPVLALCKQSNGDLLEKEIKRIKSKDVSIGWQWSGIEFDSYFTLEVVNWKYLSQLSFSF